MLIVNEHPYPWQQGLTLGKLADAVKPFADVLVVNGVPSSRDTPLQDGDVCTLIKKGQIPSILEMELILAVRHTPEVARLLKQSTVGIMGLGGLGSAVSISLCKVGVGRLLLADYDVVELSNIHRQHYFIDQIGQLKTTALKNNLVRINPFVSVEKRDIRLTAQSIPAIFQDVDVLIECFDDPVLKAMALQTALKRLPDIGYIGSSGMAGHDSGNSIQTRKIRPRVYIVGDNTSDVREMGSFLAPRVGIAAHHQANQAVRLLLGIDEE